MVTGPGAAGTIFRGSQPSAIGPTRRAGGRGNTVGAFIVDPRYGVQKKMMALKLMLFENSTECMYIVQHSDSLK